MTPRCTEITVSSFTWRIAQPHDSDGSSARYRAAPSVASTTGVNSAVGLELPLAGVSVLDAAIGSLDGAAAST
eukprot:4667886-Prymnesium_polylepis.1